MLKILFVMLLPTLAVAGPTDPKCGEGVSAKTLAELQFLDEPICMVESSQDSSPDKKFTLHPYSSGKVREERPGQDTTTNRAAQLSDLLSNKSILFHSFQNNHLQGWFQGGDAMIKIDDTHYNSYQYGNRERTNISISTVGMNKRVKFDHPQYKLAFICTTPEFQTKCHTGTFPEDTAVDNSPRAGGKEVRPSQPSGPVAPKPSVAAPR